MDPTPEDDLHREWFAWIPWPIRSALGHLIGTAFLTGMYLVLRGRRPTAEEIFGVFCTSFFLILMGDRGVRRSPWGVQSRFRRLFRQSAEPELVAITEVLSEAGESRYFEAHRQAVDRFMRGMISEREFYASMRVLAGQASSSSA